MWTKNKKKYTGHYEYMKKKRIFVLKCTSGNEKHDEYLESYQKAKQLGFRKCK